VSEIDREEWARVILELLATEADGNRTELARLIGVDYQTIRRWIAGAHKVSEENVRTVARAFKLNTTDLLVRVGYYKADEMTAQTEPSQPKAGDKVTALVKAAELRPSVKRELYQLIRERREQFEGQLTAEIERLIATELRARRSA
jgi:DNA-binding transcriptional regulator YdaS (Cro superfamily)